MVHVEQNVEVSIADIWATIKRYKWIIIVAPLVCGILAYIQVTYVQVPKWGASAILQLGQVGGEKIVETPAIVIARIENPSFAIEMLKQSDFKSEQYEAAKGIYQSSLKVKKVKDTDLVEIKLMGYSPDMARNLAISTFKYLQSIHDEMSSASIVRIKSQIQNINEEIKAATNESRTLRNQPIAKHEWSAYNAALSATVLHDIENQLRDMKQKKLLLIEKLSPTMTFSTKIQGGLTVSEKPVSPNKPFMIELAILLGLIAGIFVAFLHNAVRKNAT
jgi:LPS O-antigen subunit length determinant protein (WzzB/FepE family)